MSPIESPILALFRAPLLEKLKALAHVGLFGAGGMLLLPSPPKKTLQPAPDGQGPAHQEIDKVNATLEEMKKQLDELHKAGESAAAAAGANSDDGRMLSERILSEGGQLDPGLTAQGTTPEADAGRMAAIQQQVDELAKNVQDKANKANDIADSLRNMGMGGMPGLGGGMPGLGGGPGMGMPAGLSPLGGSGLGAPSPVSAPGGDAMKPAEVSKLGDDVLKPSPIQDSNAPVAAPVAGTGATAPPAGNAPPPGTAATPAPEAKPKAEAASTSKEITLPGGQVVTARSAEAAQAVRNALEKPTGTGDMATAAYAGTGVDIPTDGADPGHKVDPADVKPGDIAVCDDHTAIVAGNGQLIGPDGQLQPLGVINDWQGFKGFFDPTASADAAGSTAAVPVAAAPQPPPAAAASDATVLAAGPARPPTGAGTTHTPASPGFGLPATPQNER